MLRHRRLALIVLLAGWAGSVLCLGCAEKEVDLTSPERAIGTYVRAYNHGNERTLRMCGMASDLNGVFTITDIDEYGNSTLSPVDGIQHTILKSIPGRTTVTRMFTTKTVTLVVHFTSRFEPRYERTAQVRLQGRRTAYDEEETWTIL